VTATDPRFEGEAFQTWESDTYAAAPGATTGVEVTSATLSIVNEAGTWASTGYGGTYPDGSDMGNGPIVFIGGGEYEGLVAFMSMAEATSQCNDIQSIIVDRPPVPEPYLPE
jgi:hypothetical protein